MGQTTTGSSPEPLIVDPIMGVVRWVTDYVAGPDEPDIAHAVASVADRRWDHAGVEIYAGGYGLVTKTSSGRVVRGGLGPTGIQSTPSGQSTVARYSELGDQAADPRLFDLFHDEIRARADFPYGPIDAETELSWVWSWSLGEARPKWFRLPEFFPPRHGTGRRHARCRQRERCCDQFDTGVGDSRRFEDEVVDRDTFMIAWSNRLPMTGVTIDATTDWNVGRYVSAFNRIGI